MIEIKRSPKRCLVWRPTLLDTLYVIEPCIGENKIAELGPKEIVKLYILYVVHYFMPLFNYQTLWNLFPIYSRIHGLNMLINRDC